MEKKMHIDITGHHIEITPALRKFTEEKFEKLTHHGCHINSIHVTFTVEKLSHLAEATIHVKKAEVHAHTESDNMYSAIDLLIDKLDRQLIKHKEKSLDHRDHRDKHASQDFEE
jgi:putative sigma-54 modulation protein